MRLCFIKHLDFHHICHQEDVWSSDGEVKRSEPMKLSTQLYRKKVHNSKLFKTAHACGQMNNTFQSAAIHYSCWFHIWFYTDSLF